MKQFYELDNHTFFLWQGDLYQKVENVFKDGNLERGISRVIAWIDGNTYTFLKKSENGTHINPYANVQPVEIHLKNI